MVYLYSAILTDIADLAHGLRGNLKQQLALINRAVRDVAGDVDLRSTKRKSALSPSLSEYQYQYTKPTDLKGWGIIDVKPQVHRDEGWLGEFTLTTAEEFDRMKQVYRNVCAIQDADGVGKLLLSGNVDDDRAVMHDMDSLTGDGTWGAVAASGVSNLTIDTNNFVNGTASINFDLDAVGTAPAIALSTEMTDQDLTAYTGQNIFVWVYIPVTSATDLGYITNAQLRWGQGSSQYYQRQVTTNNEGTAFAHGWNLLNFPWDGSVSETGTPTLTAIDYLHFGYNLSSAITAASTDWRVDYIVARAGVVHDVIYYSKYLWQSSTGTYIENSTATTDYVNADTEEYNLILARIDYLVARALKDTNQIKLCRDEYEIQKANYVMKYPSEAKPITTSYYSFESLDENVSNDTN